MKNDLLTSPPKYLPLILMLFRYSKRAYTHPALFIYKTYTKLHKFPKNLNQKPKQESNRRQPKAISKPKIQRRLSIAKQRLSIALGRDQYGQSTNLYPIKINYLNPQINPKSHPNPTHNSTTIPIQIINGLRKNKTGIKFRFLEKYPRIH